MTINKWLKDYKNCDKTINSIKCRNKTDFHIVQTLYYILSYNHWNYFTGV